ncbi:androgen-dependent TFPI-regulating protein-like [Epargyreus clarus]|uniref:androgen-dependent TFPI-regulating protein-like n=1 Tax=Epargyreus clarus TaxID=520877 RepID=UPI003C30DB38
MLKLDSSLVRSGNVLIKIRLFVYVTSLLHLVVVATHLLSQDYSKSKDPNLQVYVKLKWKLITAWFNLLTAPYILISIYCEWKALKRESQSKNILRLNKARNFLFNSIILPVTLFGDILFWRIYNKDRRLLMPLSADEYISMWNQHSMHTISLLFVLFDLACVPRKRPKNMTPQILALTAFLTLYVLVIAHSISKGEYVYPGIRLFSTNKLLVTCVYMYIANFFYYTGQWFVVDLIWGQRGTRKKIA